MTLQSISGHEQNRIRWKTDPLRRWSVTITSIVPDCSIPVAYQLITGLPYWISIRKFQIQQPMRAPNPSWGSFLLSVAKGKTYEIQDWRELQKCFHVLVTKDINAAHVFSVTEQNRTILLLLAVSGSVPPIILWTKSTIVCNNGEPKRLSHSASHLLSLNSSNHYPIAPDYLKLSKSISLRRLIHLTSL
jgi:hypothetical protein